MTGILILILIVFGVPYIWRLVKPYFFRWITRRSEDYIRKAMGMPPRDRQKSNTTGQSKTSDRTTSFSQRSYRHNHSHSGAVIPKEYAEDVEFTEIKTFSDEHIISGSGEVNFKRESQVSDAEIIEIRKDK